MYLVELNYKVDLSEIDKHIQEHREFLNSQYQSGNFLVSGRKVPRTGGIIIALVTSLDEVNDIIQQDPFFKYNLAEYRITEFYPTQCLDKARDIFSL